MHGSVRCLWLWVLVSRGTNRGKYRCSSGVTEYGSMVVRMDLRAQDETQRCILFRAIGALHLVVVVLCIREHPNRGLQRECKRFSMGSLGAILWLVSGEVASSAMEKTDGGGGALGHSSLGCSALNAELGEVWRILFCLVSTSTLCRIRPPLINQGRSGIRQFEGWVYGLLHQSPRGCCCGVDGPRHCHGVRGALGIIRLRCPDALIV
jgi:hypothetical protein